MAVPEVPASTTLSCNHLHASFGDKYCIDCGERLTKIKVEKEHSVVFQAGRPAYLTLLGSATDAIEVSFERLGGHGEVGEITWKGIEGKLRLDLSRMQSDEVTTLVMVSQDGPRSANELWCPRPRRETFIQVRRVDQTLNLDVIPGLLLFSSRAQTRKFKISNTGNDAVDIGRPEVTAGFRVGLADSSGFRLEPGESREMEVFRDGERSMGEIRFVGTGGSPEAKCALRALESRKPSIIPGFVVAIDFGTSNTSVFAIRGDGEPESIPLPGSDRSRVPTVVFAQGPKEGWEAFSEGKYDEQDLTRNLKALVRAGDATVGGASGGNVDEVLTFYLRQILVKAIEPYLQHRDPRFSESVEFVFTVPVLDFSEGEDHEPVEFNRYLDRVMKAARKAGYEDDDRRWTIDYLLEPNGGALEVVLGDHLSTDLADNDLILVVDCGGGTTDVTLASVTLQGGRGLAAARNASGRSHGLQFGGTLVTYDLGVAWAHSDEQGGKPKDTESYLRYGVERAEALRARGWARSERADIPFTSFQDVSQSEEPKGNDPHSWIWRFPPLREFVERAKVDLSQKMSLRSDSPWTVMPFSFSSDPAQANSDMERWEVTPGQLDRAVHEGVTDVVNSVTKFLDNEGVDPRKIRHVIAIGGSARLPHLTKQLRETFGANKVAAVDDYVDTAVCKGATRRYHLHLETLPVGIELRLDNVRETVAAAGLVIGDRRERSTRYSVPAGATLKGALIATVGTSEHTLANIRIHAKSTPRNGKVVATLTATGVLVQTEEAGAAPQTLAAIEF